MLNAHIYGFTSFLRYCCCGWSSDLQAFTSLLEVLVLFEKEMKVICSFVCHIVYLKNIARILISLLVMASAAEWKMQLMTCFSLNWKFGFTLNTEHWVSLSADVRRLPRSSYWDLTHILKWYQIHKYACIDALMIGPYLWLSLFGIFWYCWTFGRNGVWPKT